MATQHQIWTEEYEKNKNFGSTNTEFPSRVLETYFKNKGKRFGKALDMGCGEGRNSIYLAQLGYEVVGIDFVHSAIEKAKQKAEEKKLEINFIEQSLSELIPLPDESFDLIIDMMVMHSLHKEDRTVYHSEVQRLLKPNGSFLFYTIAVESPEAERLFTEHPGPEEYSYIIPETGAFEKAFTKEDLTKALPILKVEKLQDFTFDVKFGESTFQRVFYYGVMRKL